MMIEDVRDPLTGVWSRFGLLFFAEQHVKLLRRVKREAILFVVGIEGLPTDGTLEPAHEAGVREAARLLRRTFRTSDAVARVESGVFAVLLLETSPLAADGLRCRLEDRLVQWREEHPDVPPLSLSMVVDRIIADQEMSFLDVLSRNVATLHDQWAAGAGSNGGSPLAQEW
ncbi:MAG: hypothetical protein KGJ14_03685 [Nitrospirota bacterium]|nr:hypothetical protein [Nitrospirota bacterium]